MTKSKIKMNPIKDSSVVSAYGYDQETRTLHVTFKGGKTYEHVDVPPEKFAAFTGASSTGKFYNTKIRNQYSSQKLK